MERYVDGYVIPIKKENVERYREMAQKAGEIWMEHGALEFYETIGDDLDIENSVSFKKLANISDDETVIFSWIVYESREQRDKINELIMNDPRITEDMAMNKDVFDMTRMTVGGFKPVVVLEK
jgi:uncharacterized protein YbaA (DUF1428 family)